MAVPACRRMRKFARRKVRLRAKSPSCSCRVLTQPPATLSARPRSAQTLRASSVRRNAWAMVTLGGAALGKSRQPPRPLGLPFCAMCCRLRLDVPPVSLRLVSWPCAKNVAPLRRVACRGFPNPARNLRFLDLPLAAPCSPASSSALCANIARFFYALRRMGSGVR